MGTNLITSKYSDRFIYNLIEDKGIWYVFVTNIVHAEHPSTYFRFFETLTEATTYFIEA